MNRTTLLVMDTIEDRLIEQSRELLGFVTASDKLEHSHTILLISGKNVAAIASQLIEDYGLNVLVCEDDRFHAPNPELLRLYLEEVIDEVSPGLVAFLHNMRNCQAASALAVNLDASCVTGVEGWNTSSDRPVLWRSVVNGRYRQSVSPMSDCCIVTVMPGAFLAPDKYRNEAAAAMLLRRTLPVASCACQPSGISQCRDNDASLDSADVIVAAGRGVGTEKNLNLIREFASIFTHAAIGGSRPLCDLKWLPHSRQVGVSGKTVTPRLYIACGISGAQQHLAGIKGADCIVALNADPEAAIFSVADYIVIEDLHEFLPLLLQRYRERFGA